MALVVSAETARAQIASVAERAQALKAEFTTLVDAIPASSISDVNRKQRIDEIEAKATEVIRALFQLLKEFGAIKIAYQQLPEWRGKNIKWRPGAEKEDTLLNLFTESQKTVNGCIHNVNDVRKKAIADLGGVSSQVQGETSVFETQSAPA